MLGADNLSRGSLSTLAVLTHEMSAGEMVTPKSSINHLYGTWKNVDMVKGKVETPSRQQICEIHTTGRMLEEKEHLDF